MTNERFDEGVKERLDKASELWSQGQAKLIFNEKESEMLMRQSLSVTREAFHLSDGSNAIGGLLHQRGSTIHSLFKCPLTFENGSYFEDCPVVLSHIPLGFSVGGSGVAICSICGKDPWECEHVTGYVYDGVPTQKILGSCNICGKESCDHEVGKAYDKVKAVRIITDLHIEEISLVKNPMNPLARIQRRSISSKDIYLALPPSEKASFIPGETVINCDHCAICHGTDTDTLKA
jgi:hypothetical protein